MNREQKYVEYKESMDKIVQGFWKEFYNKLKSVDLANKNLLRLELLIPVSDEFMRTYGLQDSGIEFKLIIESDVEYSKVEPCFYTNKIKPEGFYLLPDDYEEVNVLEVLEEVVKQKKYNPDIKHLQSKKFRENEVRN